MIKRVAPALFTILLASQAAAQQGSAERSNAPKTKLETFTGASGVVTIKGYSKVGSVSGTGEVAVTVITLRNPNGDKQNSGLAIDVEEATGRSSLQKERRSFVDLDEIQGLIDGIKYVSKVKKDVTPLNNFEASYNTRGDFQVTTFNSARNDTGAAVRAGGGIIGATAYLNEEQLTRLSALIEQGRKILETAK